MIKYQAGLTNVFGPVYGIGNTYEYAGQYNPTEDKKPLDEARKKQRQVRRTMQDASYKNHVRS